MAAGEARQTRDSHSVEPVLDTIARLGPWFHNLHLPGGIQTAPNHFLGDFPMRKWHEVAPHIPEDLSGWKCLDIGCNAGFYSFELARRGAKVVGIDSEALYLNQARWVAETYFPENMPEFRQMQIHDLARPEYRNEKFDLVLFMGVFYHLRYPSLALDTVSRLVRRQMIFQTLTMDEVDLKQPRFEPSIYAPKEDYTIMERSIFQEKGWPKLAFVEKKFSNDATNWFMPNHAAIEALLRSTGFDRFERIGHEMYLCHAPVGGVERNRSWSQDEWLSATGNFGTSKGVSE